MIDKLTTDYSYDRVEALLNPDATFDGVRPDGDVVWSNKMGRWLILSKSASIEAMRDKSLHVYDLFSIFTKLEGRVKIDLTHLKSMCDWIPFLHDGPRHLQLRGLFGRVLADIKTEYLAEYNEVSKDLLGDICTKGYGDLALDYGDRLHSETLGRLAGLTSEDSAWIASVAASQGSIDFAASVSEMLDMNERTFALLERLSVLTTSSAKLASFMNRLGKHFSSCGIEDTKANRLQCFTALIILGRDTLSGTVTIGMNYLLDANNGELTKDLWGVSDDLVDEFIRLSSAVQISIRVASQETIIAGQNISKGDMVMIFLPAANHDPQVYSCPHAVKVGQDRHVAFGGGRHLCVGLPLSQEAIKISLKHLSMLDTIIVRSGRSMDGSRNTRKFKTFPITVKGKL
jgi:cytochrome P450